MKRIPILLAAAAALAVARVAHPAPPAAAARPNIVIILVDDQGWGDLGATGNTTVRTPAIDSLARDGVTLDRFYVCPVCSPTRAEMLTGRYHPRTGVRGVSTGQERLDTDEATLADAFKAAGYATGAFGKWHNGSQWPYHPNARGFDEYYGFTSGHWGEYFDAPMDHNGKPVRGRGFTVDDFTDHGMAFIETNRNRPFLCYLAYNTPHSPFIVPGPYWDRYKDRPVAQRGPDGDRETVDVTRATLAMAENIDWNVGRLLAHLDRLGLRETTLVLYFSDNGPNSSRWNGGMKGRKGSTDEGGVRSACFLRWPGRIPAGSVVREIAGAIDLLPTFTALAGVPRAGTKPLDGADLSPLLLGTAKDWPDRAIVSHWGGRVSVRTQTHRLDAAGALFDMTADPGQATDIRDRQPAVAAKLAAIADTWRRDMGGAVAAPPSPAPAATAAKGKGKGKGAASQVLPPDDRPYPVGHAVFPRTPLPARDGEPHGGVKRSAGAPNCSYFVNWTSPDDSMTWDIEVATTGDYDVEILYAAPEAGSAIELSFGASKLAGTVAPAWDPPLITNQDVIPRPAGESVMKDFRPLNLGVLRLEKGRGTLTLRATKVAGREVMQVRGIALTLRTPPKS